MEITIKFGENGKILPFAGGRQITMDESPFLIFLASAGMCSAVYVRAFLMQRGMLILQPLRLKPLWIWKRVLNWFINLV